MVRKLMTPWNPPPEFIFSPPKSEDAEDGVLWSFDPAKRLVIVDFTKVSIIARKHKDYFGQIMERDDITLISEGLYSAPEVLSVENALKTNFQAHFYHKFRWFDQIRTKTGLISYKEKDGNLSMRVKDYLRFLEMRTKCPSKPFEFVGADLKTTTRIRDPTKVVIYMLDMNMERYLRLSDKEFKAGFKLPEILPGGAWCMMHHVSACRIFIPQMTTLIAVHLLLLFLINPPHR